jgi:restriction endonuclease S subunit
MIRSKKAYKDLIAKTDELVKSQFIEMFGDPVLNSKRLPIKTLPEIGENLDSQRIPITSGNRKQGIYPYYGASGVVDYVDDYIFDEDILLISEDGANLLARVTPIAFSATGKVWVNNHAHVMRFSSMATQVYVERFLNMIDISTYVTGTAQPKLNQAKLNSIPIPFPSEQLMQDYMEIIAQSDKSKFAAQQTLKELNDAQKALMKKIFD